jgi:hypothetical protein
MVGADAVRLLERLQATANAPLRSVLLLLLRRTVVSAPALARAIAVAAAVMHDEEWLNFGTDSCSRHPPSQNHHQNTHNQTHLRSTFKEGCGGDLLDPTEVSVHAVQKTAKLQVSPLPTNHIGDQTQSLT